MIKSFVLTAAFVGLTFAGADNLTGDAAKKNQGQVTESEHAANPGKNIGTVSDAKNSKEDQATTSNETANVQRIVDVRNVETLQDEPMKYDNKKVSVAGKVEKKISDRMFVLESGLGFDNEIVVVTDPKLVPGEGGNVEAFNKLQVIGTVRAVPVVNVREELSWDLDPQIEAELEGMTTFIVADQIRPWQ